MYSSKITIEKYDYIDSLRGFAVLGVILTHCGYMVQGLPAFVQNFAIEGSRGVQLFFIISAFTLFNSYGKRANKETNGILKFYIRRFFRVAPMFYLAIIYYLFYSNSFSSVSLKHLLSVVTFTNGWNPQWINSIVPGGWSVAVEMTFYLVVPLIFKIVNNIKKAAWAVFIVLIISDIIHWIMLGLNYNNDADYLNYIFYFLPNQLPIFMLGIFLYFYLKKSSDYIKISYNLILTFSVFMMIALVNGGSIGNTYNVEWIPHIVLWGIAFMMFAIGMSLIKKSNNFAKNFLKNKYIRFYGKISFSAYLVHFTFLQLGVFLMNKIIIIIGYNLAPSFRLLILWILVSLFTLSVASFTHYFIEKPGIKIGNALIEVLDRRKSVEYKNIKKDSDIDI